MSKKLLISLITGALLGVVCILGATLRYQESVTTLYLFSFWFNRLLMGLVIGLVDHNNTLIKRLLKGAFLGLFVSFAFYSATDFYDLTGFIVGLVYGVIIILVQVFFENRPKKEMT